MFRQIFNWFFNDFWKVLGSLWAPKTMPNSMKKCTKKMNEFWKGFSWKMEPKWRPREAPGEPKWRPKWKNFVDISQPPPRSPPTPLQGLQKVAKIDQNGCQNGPKRSPRDPSRDAKRIQNGPKQSPRDPSRDVKGSQKGWEKTAQSGQEYEKNLLANPTIPLACSFPSWGPAVTPALRAQ